MIAYPDFTDCSVLIIGDIILDRYLWGDVDRLSPEAPVPVVNVTRKTTNLGGAGNVAMNLKGLGCHHTLIGTRGDDTNGAALLEILNQENIENFILMIPGHPTTTKTRIIGQNQQLVRLDEEDQSFMTDGHKDTLVQHINKSLPDADVVILSDYGKGLLAPELTRQIISQCNAENIPVFIDPKGVSWEKYQSATVITPNSTEFSLVAPYSEKDPATLERQADKLLHQLNLEYLLVTRGAKGMSLLQRNKTAKACDVWLELWTYLKRRFKPEFRDVEEAETIFSGCEFISNYCQDLEIELGNAGISDPVYYQKRIAYCDEFCSIFPESGELLMHNMKRAIAESNFALGNIDESDKCFKELIELYPRNIWGYIGWGDMYLWSMKNDIKPNYERAEQIYKMALGKDIEGEKDLIDRLNELKKERDRTAKQ